MIQRRLKIGPYQMLSVPTGLFGLDGGAMFGTVPRVLWEKLNPPDAANRISMEARTLLMLERASDGSVLNAILVDTGIGADFSAKYGEKLGAKFCDMYAIDEANQSVLPVERSLNRLGLQTTDITAVILTHLHFDHAGGATRVVNGELVPSFPNARYYVQRANLETARQPNVRERASYFAANFEPLIKAGVLEILDGDFSEVLPHVSLIVSNGHTRGQQVVKISDGQETLVYCADLIPTSSHVRLAWIMGYDLDPLLIIDEKKRLLEQAAANNWYLFFEHDPSTDAARVSEAKGDFSVSERVLLENHFN